MKKTSLKVSLILFSVIFLLTACNLPSAADENPPADEAEQARQTAEAILTSAVETAQAVEAVQTQPMPPSPIPTVLATTAAPPTSPPPTATNTPVPCNRAAFIKDVTYPDNSEVAAGATFTKTWRLKNVGSCTWTSGYQLVFQNGDPMDAPATLSITSGTVAPGESVDISVTLTAPDAPGTYQGNFKLRSPDNIVFGIHADGDGMFWVKIVVPAPTATPTATSYPTLPPPPPPLMPDLFVQQITYDPPDPHMGDTVLVSVYVYNQGDAAAGAYHVEWYAAGPTLGCAWDVSGNNAHGGKTLSCQYTYQGWNHAYVTEAIVDTGNDVDESDESNNTYSIILDVSP